MAIAATNRFNVRATPIDYSSPYAPTTQSIHGFGIEIDGVIIGRIKTWEPAPMDRTVDLQKELNPLTYGQPVDAVPGGQENFTLSFTRGEVWGAETEVAFGADRVYSLLTNQSRPFVIDEVLYRGTQLYRRWRYLGCWFTQKSLSAFEAEGSAFIEVQGEMVFVNRIRIN